MRASGSGTMLGRWTGAQIFRNTNTKGRRFGPLARIQIGFQPRVANFAMCHSSLSSAAREHKLNQLFALAQFAPLTIRASRKLNHCHAPPPP